MKRTTKDYFTILCKGIAMGAADAVPGVSGGTIAFISGIYEELISSINQINTKTFLILKNKGIKAAWKQINGAFLLTLVTGIFISFLSLMKVAKFLLEHYPILLWSFFFGLVMASVLFIIKQVKKWSLVSIIAMLAAMGIAYYITTLPSLADNNSLLYLFIAAAIAICAMILPGISGAFILVLLGAYKTLGDAIDNYDIKKLFIFALGAVFGLLSFSKLLKWLFNNYKNTTLAILTGFVIGSLNKLWPWKETLTTRIDSHGTVKPMLQQSISPNAFLEHYQTDPQLGLAIGLMIFGFCSIIILEKIGEQHN